MRFGMPFNGPAGAAAAALESAELDGMEAAGIVALMVQQLGWGNDLPHAQNLEHNALRA